MQWMLEAVRRMRALARRDDVENRLAEEIRFHVDQGGGRIGPRRPAKCQFELIRDIPVRFVRITVRFDMMAW